MYILNVHLLWDGQFSHVSNKDHEIIAELHSYSISPLLCNRCLG